MDTHKYIITVRSPPRGQKSALVAAIHRTLEFLIPKTLGTPARTDSPKHEIHEHIDETLSKFPSGCRFFPEATKRGKRKKKEKEKKRKENSFRRNVVSLVRINHCNSVAATTRGSIRNKITDEPVQYDGISSIDPDATHELRLRGIRSSAMGRKERFARETRACTHLGILAISSKEQRRKIER